MIAEPTNAVVLAAMLHSAEAGSDRAAPPTGRQLVVDGRTAASLWDWLARCIASGRSLDLECVADWRVTIWFEGSVLEEVGIRTRPPCADRVVAGGRWHGPCGRAEAVLRRALSHGRWYEQCSVELPDGIGQPELERSSGGPLLLAPWSWFRQQRGLVVAAEVEWSAGRCPGGECVVSGREREELARVSGVLAGVTAAMLDDRRVRIGAVSVVCPTGGARADEARTCKMELELSTSDAASLEAVAGDLAERGFRAKSADLGKVHAVDVLVPDPEACADLRRWAVQLQER